jgi:hypothetical protein
LFRCQMCNTVVGKRVRTFKLVVQTRTKQFDSRGTLEAERPRWRSRSGPKKSAKFDKGGQGTEIVNELSVCPQCAEKHKPVEVPAEEQAEVHVEEHVEEQTEVQTDE